MGFKNRKRLGDILLENNKITQKQLDFVLKKQKDTGGRVGKILVDEGIITEDDILDALHIQLGIERVHFGALVVNIEAVKKIPEAMAKKYNIIPVNYDSKKIFAVTSDPLNIVAIDDIRMYTGLDVKLALAGSGEVAAAIGKYYSGQQVEKAADELSKQQDLTPQKQKQM